MLNRTQLRVRLLIIRYKGNLHEEVCNCILYMVVSTCDPGNQISAVRDYSKVLILL